MTGPATGQAPWPHFPPDEVGRAAEVLASGRVNYWTWTEGRSFGRALLQEPMRQHDDTHVDLSTRVSAARC